MAIKPTKKIIEALTLLSEGFLELQEHIEVEGGSGSGQEKSYQDYDDDQNSSEDDETEGDEAFESILVTECRDALDAVIEGEDLSTADVAVMLSTLSEALEEIDPSVFADDDDRGASSTASIYQMDDDEEYEEYDEDDEEYDDADDDDDDYAIDDLDED